MNYGSSTRWGASVITAVGADSRSLLLHLAAVLIDTSMGSQVELYVIEFNAENRATLT